MRINLEKISLVLAGSWNPAILQPAWIVLHGMGRDDPERIQVQVEVGLSQLGQMTKFRFDDFVYSPQRHAVIFAPVQWTQQVADVIQSIARNVLTKLTHTPVTAVGFNFEFQAEEATDVLARFASAQEDVVERAPAGFNVSSNSVKTAITKDRQTVNITRSLENDVVTVGFNFNFEVNSSAEAAALLESNSFFAAFEQAKEMASGILGEELGE
jgi:hypothetical protein